jgi:hypothetical protein
MSEVAQEAQHEFWRPPSPLTAAEIVNPVSAIEPLPSMDEACSRCGSEFLMGSRFCHSCGGRRLEAISASTRADAAVIAGLWQQIVERTQSAGSALAGLKFPTWLRYLQFHEIKTRVGLSTASLIAFLIGLGCVAGALLVGLLTAKTFVDWQAIQFYRAEWLLAATASFVAGILLKKSTSRDRE